MARECVLYDRDCIGCGECDRCDLDPEKICDNCMKCVQYWMNEPTVIQYVFGLNHLHEVMGLNMLTSDWHCISEPKDLFELVRTEDIAALDAEVPVKRVKLVATDGATNYKREYIDAMDDETFAKWMDYHFAICERQDLIGASHHTLDILQKE